MTCQPLERFADIADQFDAIFCDVWGVIHNGRRAFAPACDALSAFRRSRGPVILITNAPVPAERVTGLFRPLGVPDDCFDDVATSGEATRAELARRAPGPVLAIGRGDDRSLYDGLALTFSSADDAQVVSCTGFRDETRETPNMYREEFAPLAARGVPMVCANPDVQYRLGDRLIWGAGALAQVYESLGGEVVMPGKPFAPIYALAASRLESITRRPAAEQRILAIGDGPGTDILGANRQGLKSLFIGGGIHGAALSGSSDFASAAAHLLETEGVKADWAMPALA